jgi:SSS family solute:Na+ symporter
VLVSVVLLPAFFRGKLLTVYQLIGQRFSPQVGRLAAAILLLTRCLSDGFRLFATGLVGAAVLASIPAVANLAGAMSPTFDGNTILVSTANCLIGTVTLPSTLLGGMRVVVWTDLTQLIVYLAGSAVVGLILLSEIPSGWIEIATSAGKFRLFDFALDATQNYTFSSAVIGGIFLTSSTHGTDQLLVQRYLSSRSISDAQRALLVSGFVVFVQFTLLLAHRDDALDVLYDPGARGIPYVDG